MMKRSRHNLISLLASVFLIHGCGGTIGGSPGIFGGGNKKTNTSGTEVPGEQPVPTPLPPPLPTTANGLTFSLSNMPLEGAKNVYLRITRLDITRMDGTQLSVPLASTNEVDILPLQDGKSQVLGSLSDLPAGVYNQTRLQLAADPAGRLIDANGVEYPLTIPAGSETGLTITAAFTKVDGVPLSMTLNFDLQQSIDAVSENSTRRYVLKPVIRLSDNSKTGAISGRGPEGAEVCAYTEGSYRPGDDDDDDEDDCSGSYSSTRVQNGVFTLPFLDPGRYDLRFLRGEALVGEAKAVEVQAGKTNSAVNVP
jgi:hypothetical protein